MYIEAGTCWLLLQATSTNPEFRDIKCPPPRGGCSANFWCHPGQQKPGAGTTIEIYDEANNTVRFTEDTYQSG